MVGEGIADLPRVIANLRTIGYRGPLSLELFNRAFWSQDPSQVVQRGIDGIRHGRGLTSVRCEAPRAQDRPKRRSRRRSAE